jgi:hypothetical protein
MMHPWLSRLRHDLVKRAVWPARDLRDASGEPGPADLMQLRRGLLDLRDEDGRALTATDLWKRLRAEAPALPAAALDAFGGALREAEGAVSNLPGGPGSWRAALDAVLRIEPAFAKLARTLEGE